MGFGAHVSLRRFARGMTVAISLGCSLYAVGPGQTQVAITPPPAFSACAPGAAPPLPKSWRAVGLMMPFLDGQLDVGEFEYDGALPAARATVYGLESGTADLLITKEGSYLLSGPSGAPTGCMALGRKFALPPASWIPEHSACVGQTHLGTVQVQWWKSPGRDGHATWHWLRADNGLPWRSMFVSRAADPAIVGDYAMTYFPLFQPSPQTNLSALRDLCARSATPAVSAAAFAQTARDLMEIRNPAAEVERPQRIAQLVPGLSGQSCSAMTPVRWPERFVATAVITPISFSDDPYSALIYYDWPDAESQFAILWQGLSPAFRGVVALRKGIGYQPGRASTGAFHCPAIYPGMVRPDWASTARCRCKGVLDHQAALGPDEAIQIFACPIREQGKRVMWNWYTSKGRPLLFAEAAARGVGAMLADYHEWLPGHEVPRTDFALPKECAPDNIPPGSDAGNPSCSDCHTTR